MELSFFFRRQANRDDLHVGTKQPHPSYIRTLGIYKTEYLSISDRTWEDKNNKARWRARLVVALDGDFVSISPIDAKKEKSQDRTAHNNIHPAGRFRISCYHSSAKSKSIPKVALDFRGPLSPLCTRTTQQSNARPLRNRTSTGHRQLKRRHSTFLETVRSATAWRIATGQPRPFFHHSWISREKTPQDLGGAKMLEGRVTHHTTRTPSTYHVSSRDCILTGNGKGSLSPRVSLSTQ